MKKAISVPDNKVRHPRAAGGGKIGVPTAPKAEKVTLTPSRRREPAGLLKEHFGENGEVHAVKFEYFNPAASVVCVAGGFNGWQPSVTPMTKQHDGRWATEVLLKPGFHEYRLVVDGQWQDDPMASRFVSNCFGGLNCVVEVKPTSVQV